jgi:ribose-phosphate pyrophosphokinase
MMVFTGSANPALAEQVAKHLGIALGRADVGRFSDGEVMLELLENVRGKDVFVLQSTSHPTNDTLMEVMVMVDALRRSSAGRITAAIPYLGYSRQDRRPRSARVAITAKVVANMLTSVGVNRLLTMDLHSDQIQGFGGVVRARAAAKQLNSDLAIIDKRRPKANVAKVMNIIGEVAGRNCVIMDDMVDTANTLCEAAAALKAQGAKKVLAYATHPILSGNAADRIADSALDELVVTNTIPLNEASRNCKKIRQLSAAGLIAETIKRISQEESVSSLFMD